MAGFEVTFYGRFWVTPERSIANTHLQAYLRCACTNDTLTNLLRGNSTIDQFNIHNRIGHDAESSEVSTHFQANVMCDTVVLGLYGFPLGLVIWILYKAVVFAVIRLKHP
jgi:hypothetical protein